MVQPSESYASLVISHWRSFADHVSSDTNPTRLDGHSLSLSQVVAVARHGSPIEFDETALHDLDRSHVALKDSIAHGDVIYGVNTGFGGSANTRTDKVDSLQKTLLREFNSGVLVSPLNSPNHHHIDNGIHDGIVPLHHGLDIQDLASINCMPVAWTRAAMLVRLNSLSVGCSAIRRSIVQRIYQLLEHDVIPRIPVHGSISASGDLAPLSYIGSAIQGKSGVSCTVGALKGSGQSRIMTARQALASIDAQPEKVEAKEALAIMNGTAVSCGVAALAVHEMHALVTMSEILTAMSVEALGGSEESFDPFFAQVRPHRGQVDSSTCIRRFLEGSKLLNTHKQGSATLRQDRYSIRTAAQWLGPILEDVQLAHEQVATECNSVTDNPLVDVETGGTARHLHGGNFQARAVTSAMEKVRVSIQSIGRLLFTQSTELINPVTNQGLPPNLVADEPSESFLMKSVDIMLAALLSELTFLANPVGPHVQTAEMGNQALNSLALISTRYTLTAIDVASKLVAAHILVACQALDLRVMDILFFKEVQPQIFHITNDWYDRLYKASGSSSQERTTSGESNVIDELNQTLWMSFSATFDDTTIMDSDERFRSIVKSLQPHLLTHMVKHGDTYPMQSAGGQSFIPGVIEEWASEATNLLRSTYNRTRSQYLAVPNPDTYLGPASRRMYNFVRHELDVPFLTTDVLTSASSADQFVTPKATRHTVAHSIDSVGENPIPDQQEIEPEATPTIGTFITRIYSAVTSGQMFEKAVECLEAVQ